MGEKEKIKKPKLPCGCVCVMCPLDVDYEPISLFVPTGSIYLRVATIHLSGARLFRGTRFNPLKRQNNSPSSAVIKITSLPPRAEMLRLVTPRQSLPEPLGGPTLPPWHGLQSFLSDSKEKKTIGPSIVVILFPVFVTKKESDPHSIPTARGGDPVHPPLRQICDATAQFMIGRRWGRIAARANVINGR